MISSIIRKAVNTRNIRPSFHSVIRHKAGYEGEGKTTVRVLNQETELGLMINSITTFGFRLNNGVTVLGPMMLFPRTVLSWQVEGIHDVSADSLKFLTLLEPHIDLLIVGTDSNKEKAMMAARSLNIRVEVLQPEHAAASYNFLMAEGRSVCAAMLPPAFIKLDPDDMLESKIHYDNIFNANKL